MASEKSVSRDHSMQSANIVYQYSMMIYLLNIEHQVKNVNEETVLGSPHKLLLSLQLFVQE